MNESTNIEVSQEQRELLAKFFQAEKGEKPLTKEEYDKIRDLLDKQRGGLKREAYESIKDDPNLIKGAMIDQARRDQRIMDHQAPKARDTLLKLLKSPPGEKSLTKEEFKSVAIFLDRQNGGVRRHAYQIFKDDKEIIEASKTHREAWKANSKSQESHQELPAPAKMAMDKLSERLRGKMAGLEPSNGNELQPGD